MLGLPGRQGRIRQAKRILFSVQANHLPCGVLVHLCVLAAHGQQALYLQHVPCACIGQRLQHDLSILGDLLRQRPGYLQPQAMRAKSGW